MSTFTALTLDDETLLEDWIINHFFEVEVPEDILYGDEKRLAVNPNPEFHSTLAVTGSAHNFRDLPAPTWSIRWEDVMVYCYRIQIPAATKQVLRKSRGATEERMMRQSAYNLALQVEHNLARLAKGRNPQNVPNPLAFLDSPAVNVEWSGTSFQLKELELQLKELLPKAGLQWNNLHPKFLSEGGKCMSDEQHEARAKNLSKANQVRKAKALEKARAALEIEANGTREELENFLGLSGDSLTVALSRARQRVREAEETIDLLTGEVLGGL